MFKLYECHLIDERVLLTCTSDFEGSHGNIEEMLCETCWEWKQSAREENTKETQAQVVKASMATMRKTVLPLTCFHRLLLLPVKRRSKW